MAFRSRRHLRRRGVRHRNGGGLTDDLSAELAIGEPGGTAPSRSGYGPARVIMCPAGAIMCSAKLIMCLARMISADRQEGMGSATRLRAPRTHPSSIPYMGVRRNIRAATSATTT